MPTLIEKATRIVAAGNKPKAIDEYVGRVNSGTTAVSIAHMQSPAGWVEPGQTPEFTEYTLVLRGVLRVKTKHGSDDEYEDLWQILDAADADVVLVGHEHHYERFARLDAAGRPSPRGVRQFTVGTGGKSHYGFAEPVTGSQVRSDKSYGVLELVLQPLGYRWRFLPATGRFVDTGSARCVR